MAAIASLVVVFAFGLGACGNDDSSDDIESPSTEASPAANETAVEKAPPVNRFVVATSADQPDLDVLFNASRGDLLADNVYESLTWLDADMVPRPRLADSWTQIDPTTWEFVMHPGIKFEDGSDLDSDDVVASIELVVKEKRPLTSVTGLISGAVAVDKYTVRVTTSALDGVDRRIAWMPIVPAEYARDNPEALKKVGVPGTGPYTVSGYTPGVNLVLKRKAEYWGGELPIFPEVEFQLIPEATVRLANLKTGNAHYAILPCDLVKEAPQSLSKPLPRFAAIRLGATQEAAGITRDANVRMALALAIDKDALIKGVLGSCATAWYGSFQPTSGIGFVEQGPYPFDLAKARQLLATAGVTGKSVTLVAQADGPPESGSNIAQAVAQMWEAAGLKVDLQILPKAGWREAIYQVPSQGVDPKNVPDAMFIPHDDYFGVPARLFTTNGCGVGYSAFCQPEIQKLIDQVNAQTTLEAQEPLMKQINELTWQSVSWIGLANINRTIGLAEWVQYTLRADDRIPVREMSVK